MEMSRFRIAFCLVFGSPISEYLSYLRVFSFFMSIFVYLHFYLLFLSIILIYFIKVLMILGSNKTSWRTKTRVLLQKNSMKKQSDPCFVHLYNFHFQTSTIHHKVFRSLWIEDNPEHETNADQFTSWCHSWKIVQGIKREWPSMIVRKRSTW